MKKKKVFFISIPLFLILVFALVCFLADGGRQVGKVIDAKVVKEIPEGFIPRPKGDWENGIRYVSWESQISFLDADGVCIYQTSYDNSDFIVKYNNEYYINEAKYLELIDIVIIAQEE